MTKKIIIALLCFSINIACYSQTNHFPRGTYMSFEEIVNKAPTKQLNLEIIKRTAFDIQMKGGNDYKLESISDSVSKKVIKKEIWGYSHGDTLYLNCLKFSMQTWYAPVISNGKYLIVKAGLSNYAAEQKKQLKMAKSRWAVMEGGIGGVKLATLRFLYAIDTKTQKVITVSTEAMQILLKDRNDLLTEYNTEEKKDDEFVCIKYLKLLNDDL